MGVYNIFGGDYMECCNQEKKKTIRTEEFKSDINKRINRLTGQMNGIKKMIDEDRYCQDVLIQLSAIEKSVRSLSNVILENHINNCIRNNINKDEHIADELIELVKRMR